MKFNRHIVLVLLVVGLFVYAPASQAQITVRGRLAHDLSAMSGQEISGSVIVDNETQEPQQAKVYLRDYMFFADGTNAYDDPGTNERSSAPWVRFSPENMTIPPGGSVTVSYSMFVPDSTDAGSYWSMLMVEGVDPSSAESTSEEAAERQVGFRQVTRYGVQLAVHVEGEAEQNVAFEAVQLFADEEGNTFFQADVHNIGTAMLRPNVYMRLFAEDGTEYGPLEGVQFRMYPGTSVRQRIDLSSLEAGTYQALLIVDNGDDAVFGGQYELTL